MQRGLVVMAAILGVVMVCSQARGEVSSNFDLEIYGFIKVDMAYDTGRVDPGNYARWVNSEADNEDDDQFNITANASRLGFKLSGQSDSGRELSGLLEIDLYGGGAENKATPCLRHAYVKMTWPDRRMSLLAGQTWDLVAQQIPATANFTAAWWAGNIGYRHPQLRFSKSVGLGTSADMTAELALARTLGRGTVGGFDPGDTGEDAGIPTVQGRLAWSFPMGSQRAVIGFSGHWAQEEYDLDAEGNNKTIDSYSAAVEMSLPFTTGVTLKGEAWTGENLDSYLGGIGYGVNDDLEPIKSTGGWAALELGPWGRWSFLLGGSLDDPDDELLAMGSRSKNTSLFGNVSIKLAKNLTETLEISQWTTDYLEMPKGDAIRIQYSLMYKF
ncbi:hypothetical protein JW905_13090 [bacterium]|nr:hypothetical protein [candidate division CSSED10-310 bacterium]